MKGGNTTLEIQLDETRRLLKLAQNKEKQLTEGEYTNLWICCPLVVYCRNVDRRLNLLITFLISYIIFIYIHIHVVSYISSSHLFYITVYNSSISMSYFRFIFRERWTFGNCQRSAKNCSTTLWPQRYINYLNPYYFIVFLYKITAYISVVTPFLVENERLKDAALQTKKENEAQMEVRWLLVFQFNAPLQLTKQLTWCACFCSIPPPRGWRKARLSFRGLQLRWEL